MRVTRIRQLFAFVLGYPEPKDMPNYAIMREQLPASTYVGKYLVFLHGTTWVSKHWPEEYWYVLLELANRAGYQVLLPWGNEAELQRAQRIAAAGTQVNILPRLDLASLASIIAASQGVITVDTGLGHLTAALDIPSVALYGPTSPKLAGTYGKQQHNLQADFACAPCLRRTCNYHGSSAVSPACFATLSPALVWQEFLSQCVQSQQSVVEEVI